MQPLFYSRFSFLHVLLFSVICLWLPMSKANAAATEQVFKSYKDRLLQIRIIDSLTKSKATIGSGFFIDGQGTIVTNYHVISKHVFKPDQYYIEYVTFDNKVHKASLVNIDVIHDLAILDGNAADTPALKLNTRPLEKGVRIYTLGNPLDLGMTIVEGTYNGITDDTMHERILLSGALNPGMSGGPSIIDDGRVIGVNVATAGNSIGFLVPEKFLNDLLAQPRTDSKSNFMAIIREQLLANQKIYLSALLAQPFPTKQLGEFTIPAKIADYVNCWGDSNDDEGPYRVSDNFCATKNDIFINQRISTGDIRYTHHYLQTDEMNSTRFYSLMSSYFGNSNTSLEGHKDDFTGYNCRSGFVKNADILFRTAFCLRRYREFEGIYDMVLVASSLVDDKRGLVTKLVLAGVSYESAVAFSKQYLESFAWKRP
jgi:serine protease Do